MSAANTESKGIGETLKRKLRVIIDDDQDIKHVTIKQLKLIRRSVGAVLDIEGFDRPAEVSVVICDDEEIHEINKEYRGIDSSTDVLSFPQYERGEKLPKTGYVALGDIVISAEHAARQAETYGHSFERELSFLTVHSTLHLLGYDHVNGGEEEALMREKQREAMRILGLALDSEKEGSDEKDDEKDSEKGV